MMAMPPCTTVRIPVFIVQVFANDLKVNETYKIKAYAEIDGLQIETIQPDVLWVGFHCDLVPYSVKISLVQNFTELLFNPSKKCFAFLNFASSQSISWTGYAMLSTFSRSFKISQSYPQ